MSDRPVIALPSVETTMAESRRHVDSLGNLRLIRLMVAMALGTLAAKVGGADYAEQSQLLLLATMRKNYDHKH